MEWSYEVRLFEDQWKYKYHNNIQEISSWRIFTLHLLHSYLFLFEIWIYIMI